MVSAGARITHQKQVALADCVGLLEKTSDQLDALVQRGKEVGLDVYEIEELAPLTQRLVVLRERRARLEDELRAVASEWATD